MDFSFFQAAATLNNPNHLYQIVGQLHSEMEDELLYSREVILLLEAANQGLADENRSLKTQLAKVKSHLGML